MPKIIECIQGSPVWLKARCGRITASRLCDVLATRKDGKEAAKRRDYKMDLIAERLTGISEDNWVSADMDYGTENEPMARMAYELAFDVLVDQIGFAIHPALEYSGASPDALVGKDGVLEIKVPKTTTHLEWKMASVVPEEYVPQMIWEMVCTERFYADFLSYDPRIEDPALRAFCIRLDYDQELANKYTREVMKFNEEIEEAIDKLKGHNIFDAQGRRGGEYGQGASSCWDGPR